MLVEAIAGVAPDLDALCEAGGKLAAWRYHRVLLHGIPTLPFQTPVIYTLARDSVPVAFAATTLLMVIIAALVTHLVLDTVTSFGTVLVFPFNRRRFSTH
jgi:inner membrane protein